MARTYCAICRRVWKTPDWASGTSYWMDATWEAGFNNGMVVAPIIVSSDEVTSTPLRSAPIIKSIKETGVVV